MSRAAKQLRKWIDCNYPGTRVGRYSCRDTIDGEVSQHSAKARGEYDSNALDIKGAELGSTWNENVARIDEIVEAIEPYRDEWSIRTILWQDGGAHKGHAHIDFWPTCLEHKWCGRDIVPVFKSSLGVARMTSDPNPENGNYAGPETEGDNVTYEEYVRGIVAGWAEDPKKTRQEFNRLYDQGILEGDRKLTTVNYWIGLLPDSSNSEWLGFYARTELSSWGR